MSSDSFISVQWFYLKSFAGFIISFTLPISICYNNKSMKIVSLDVLKYNSIISMYESGFAENNWKV